MPNTRAAEGDALRDSQNCRWLAGDIGRLPDLIGRWRATCSSCSITRPRQAMMTALRILLLALLIAPLLASSEVYKWTDAQGRIHYSDSPPSEAKAKEVKIRINSIQGPAVVSTLSGAPAAKAKDKVRIYTAPWCGYCKKAKAHLAARGVPYNEVDVEASEQGRSEFTRIGGRGVPVILVGDRRMDGFSAAGLDAILAGAGW